MIQDTCNLITPRGLTARLIKRKRTSGESKGVIGYIRNAGPIFLFPRARGREKERTQKGLPARNEKEKKEELEERGRNNKRLIETTPKER